MTETRADKFTRLSRARCSAAVNAMRKIGTLATRPTDYEWDEAGAKAIIGELEDALQLLKGRFKIPTTATAEARIGAAAELKGDALSDCRCALDQLIFGDAIEAEAFLRRGLGKVRKS